MGDEGLSFRSNPVSGMRGSPMGRSVFKLLRSARRGDIGNLAHPPNMPSGGKDALPFREVKPNWGMPK